MKELFPDTDREFKHPEEILLKADEKHLVIVGRDDWDPMAMSIPGGKTPAERQSHLVGFPFANRDVEGFQSKYGTVNAVCTFLQDKHGIRRLWPGTAGEVVPQRTRIALEPFEFR
ncbi:MAG: hypothetical protein JNK76_12740 [Planctomycetales bacterium]|nr:hypothetical protein [Planctomycetales bacterium]MBN8628938.1 hypothetical protein [Planctomycetota bacterium]